MLKKSLFVMLVFAVFGAGTSLNVFAQTKRIHNNQAAALLSTERTKESQDQSAKTNSKENLKQSLLKQETTTLILPNKDNLANYQNANAKGKGFSTKKKIAIGVGIAAVVVTIIVFAASRDKIRYF